MVEGYLRANKMFVDYNEVISPSLLLSSSLLYYNFIFNKAKLSFDLLPCSTFSPNKKGCTHHT